MNPDEVHDLIEALGDGDDTAYHTLLEADHEIVPSLMRHYSTTESAECRASLIEIIWQHRLPWTIPFLASALDDPNAEVWKKALDGIVTIGGAYSIKVLRDVTTKYPLNSDRGSWIAEAIDQLEPPIT